MITRSRLRYLLGRPAIFQNRLELVPRSTDDSVLLSSLPTRSMRRVLWNPGSVRDHSWTHLTSALFLSLDPYISIAESVLHGGSWIHPLCLTNLSVFIHVCARNGFWISMPFSLALNLGHLACFHHRTVPELNRSRKLASHTSHRH